MFIISAWVTHDGPDGRREAAWTWHLEEMLKNANAVGVPYHAESTLSSAQVLKCLSAVLLRECT